MILTSLHLLLNTLEYSFLSVVDIINKANKGNRTRRTQLTIPIISIAKYIIAMVKNRMALRSYAFDCVDIL